MKKKKWRKWVVIGAIVLIGIFFVLYLNQPKETALSTSPVTVGNISTDYSYSATLEAAKKQDLIAIEEAEIETVYYGAEESISKNSVLLDDDEGNEYTADFNGKVIGVNVSPGEDVKVQSVLAAIVDPSSWQMTIQADEYDVTHMQVGEAVTVHINALDRDLEGSIKQISNEAVQAGNLSVFPVVIRVADSTGLKPGMSAEVKIPKDRLENVLLADISAISYDENNKAYVQILKDDQIVRQEVEVGVSDSKKTQILSGVAEGDELILNESNPFDQFQNMTVESSDQSDE